MTKARIRRARPPSAQAPGEQGIFPRGVLEHGIGGDVPGFDALDFASGLGLVRGEGVAGLPGEDAEGGGLEDLEADAGVAGDGRVGVGAEIDVVERLTFALALRSGGSWARLVGGGGEGFAAGHFS